MGGKKKGFLNDSRGSLIYFDSGVKVHLQLEIVRKVEVFKLNTVTKPWPAGCELAIGSVPGRTNTQGLEETEEKVLPL